MKQKRIPIEDITIKLIIMHHHQEDLRRVLLTSSHWKKQQNKIFSFLKGGDETIMKKRFFSAGIVIAVIALATLFIAFTPFPNKNAQTAYAEQVAQKSLQAVSNLTPEQLQTLKQRLAAQPIDPKELLQEAKNAKDLKTLTYDQFVSQNQQVKMKYSTAGGNVGYGKNMTISDKTEPPISGKPEMMDMHNLKFLQFTDKNGGKVVLGIDQNNLPVFAFVQQKDGSVGMTVRDNGNTKGTMSGSGQMQMMGNMKNGVPETKREGIVSVQVKDGNGPVITVNGKQYTVPASVTISPNSAPPSIQVKDGDVYINGVKATPIN